ncbi:hypothetical protein C2S53_009724 [Perilla frutescens var. hirtella]|uniref:Leucine-rich repeat-containing N-terminal plant-type domain-containing protein n=1 Tax=Perilla frutescens var. hirtella TaxID=608512 RepID=A0AAD4P0C1_PERFH|nr:hypothetical protein C2S53_009724 [Perilla frutescens var. hirtella]
MFIKIAIFISLLQHFVTIFCHQYSLDTDTAALLSFKSSITSDPRSRLGDWNEGNGVCNFTGVKCGLKNRRVVYLNLNSSSLVGTISPVLSNLTQLHYLLLVENHFYGTIPSELSSLRNLIEIKLSSNNLQGPIPGSFSVLSQLKLILLNDNDLSGTIPPAFFANCTLLKNINFSQNLGEIPPSLGNATELLNLDVENNTITGELPAETFSKFHELSYLHLSDTHMISHDNNTNLEPFFSALANCSWLEELKLAGLGLGGTLPSSIGELTTNLRTFQLQENRIQGSIPPQVGNMSGLTLLNLSSNFLTEISAEIGKLSRLEQLALSYNFFSEFPVALGQLSFSLSSIDLSHNNLSGPIPEEIGNISVLTYLFLNNNLLSGEIPPSIGRCTLLHKLDLSYNRLTGKVPPDITGLREMRRFLNLSHNQLEGMLPIELSKLENVEEIDLSCNRFNGTIFSQISSCYALKLVNFSNNSIQGVLPESLGDLKSIAVIDFSANERSGPIPPSLKKIKTLTFLNLSSNNFNGMIPTDGIFDLLTNSSDRVKDF